MTLPLETKKLKRSGYFPAFLGGALLAASFPLVNMLVRWETYTALPGNPFHILTDANWQLMSMMNVLIVICGTCMMYHTEYAENGAQKMDVLPIRAGSIFFGKFIITALSLWGVLMLETAVLTACGLFWFPGYEPHLSELAGSAGFLLAASLPTVMLMLMIASACKNMWVSLGIGIILVFTFSIFPKDNLFLSLCPFSSPFQTLDMAAENGRKWMFPLVCSGETVLLGMAEMIHIKLRRCFS